MSNRPSIQVTKFINLNNDGSESGEVSYGVRVYDDYGQTYDNTYEKSSLPTTPQEALDVIAELDPDMHEFIVNEKHAFFFGNDWIELDDNGKIIEE